MNAYKEVELYFSPYPLDIGDFVFSFKDDQCVPLSKARLPSKLLGMSLCKVVEYNPVNYMSQAYVGSKISILVKGTTVQHMNPKYKLPINQRLYLSRKGKITWRNTGLYIGLTTSKQDSDGFVRVEINIGRE